MVTVIAVTPNPSVDRLWTIPGFRAGSSFRVRDPWIGAGGKGCNVARVAAQLGRGTGLGGARPRVIATGFLAGSAGDFVARDLARSGVEAAFVRLSSGETRTCPTIVDPDTGEVTEILEPGPEVGPGGVGDFEECFAALLRSVAGETAVVTLSGSLPQGAPPDLYARLIRAAAALRVPCVLDASGEPLRLGCAAAPWAVKINQAELLGILPQGRAKAGGGSGSIDVTEQALAAGLAALTGGGVRFAVVTRGRDGLLAREAASGTVWRGTLPGDLEVIQPVGSGDAATAALSLGLGRLLETGNPLPGGGAAGAPAEYVTGLVRDMVAAGTANAVTEGIGNAPPDVFAAMRLRARVVAEGEPGDTASSATR